MKKERKMLSSFTILLIIILALAVLSWVIPDVTNATLPNILLAPAFGFYDAKDVCAFVIVLGGFLEIVKLTGALDNGIATLVRKLHGKEEIMIAVIMFVFSIGGTTYGMCEETVPFYLLMASTMVAAGFDTMVGAATIALGAGVGVLGSTINPFCTGAAISALNEVGIATNAAIIDLIGVALWLTSYAVALFFVLNYAKKVKADKGSTILSLQEQEVMKTEFVEKEVDKNAVLTGKQKTVLVLFALTFVVMIVGFIPWDSFGVEFFLGWSDKLLGNPLGWWYFDEGTTWFLIMSIVIGLVARIPERDFVDTFLAGVGGIMPVVLVIATARGATVLMSETGLGEYIVTVCAEALQGVPTFIYAPVAYLLYLPLSFLVPSTSGLASLSMPIMGGITAKLGFSVETMILIFSAGNGLFNLFTPTSGALMGGLSIAKIDYPTWLKFVIKPVIVIALVNIVVVTVAMMVL